MARNNETTTKFKVDISELKKAMQEARKQVAYANSEFKEVSSSMDDWSKSSDGISAKLKQLRSNLKSQEKVLAEYERTLEEVKKEYGENSNEALEYATKLNNQRAVVNRVQREIADYEDRLTEVSKAEKIAAKTGKDVADVLEDVGNEAEDAGDGFTVLKGAVATFAGNVMNSLVGSIKDGISSMIGLADETREYRTELAKMETAALEAGASADYIKDKWHDMGAVLGDEGAVAEGLNNLLAAGFTTQKEMDTITSHLEGAAIKWKDTLKFEGLSDGLQETLATSSAVGSFGEMLERSGVNLDTFNAGLAECVTEADKQNYVLQELSKLGLNELSSAYRSQNKDLIAANRANSDYTDTLAEMGARIEPVTTSLKTGFNGLLQELLKLVGDVDMEAFTTKIEEGFAVLKDDVLPAIKEGLGWILDNKDALIAGLAGIASGFVAFKVVGLITSVITAVKNLGTAMAVLKAIMTALGGPVSIIITIISALVAAFIHLWNTSDEFRNFWINLWEKIKKICSDAVGSISKFFTVTVPEAIDKMLTFFKQLPVKMAVWLVNAIAKVSQWRSDMIAKAKEAASGFINSVINFIKQLPSKIWTWLLSTAAKVITWGANLATNAREAGRKLVDGIVNTIKDLPSKFLSIGGDLISGLWKGISGSIGGLYDNIKSSLSGLVDKAKNALGINSPSKVFADEVGKWIPEGIAVGITKNAKSALNAMKDLTADSLGSARAGLSASTGSLSGGGVVNNFYQTINSPKQLSRLDIYRQSKNLLGYAGGGV